MQALILLIAALFSAPNAGWVATNDSFALIASYPVEMGTPAALYGSFSGDNQSSSATNETFQAVRMPRDYTIQRVGATCSSTFSGGSWRAGVFKYGTGTVVIGPSMTSGGAYFGTTHKYEGSAGDELGPIVAKIGTPTLPGYCRVSVQGFWR